MARPLRVEYAGAVYHATARGNARQDIFLDDLDRTQFLEVLARVVTRFRWVCHAYCLMPNHYHLLVETPEPNLSRGMRHLNGIYTQAFNRRHNRVGHVLQGRFKAILVEKESYLVELARYVVLNPVRAGMVRRPERWRWSSYRATAGETLAPGFLTTDGVLSRFDAESDRARLAYRRFVQEGHDATVWEGLRGGVLLGREEFVAQMRPLLRNAQSAAEVPRGQRLVARPSLAELLGAVGDRAKRDQRIWQAVHEHHYTLAEVGRYLGVHYSTVSRIANRVGEGKRNARNKT